MASQNQIVLYDLPSRPPRKSWSLNPWKTRFLFNYKNLDYRTEWTEYPDLKVKFEGKCKPHEQDVSVASYTSPTIQLPDGTFMSDSRVIATEIEKRYPEPSVHLDSPTLAKLEKLMLEIMPALKGVYMPLVPVRILNEASHSHWYTTREARVGLTMDQLAKEQGGQKAWDSVKSYLDQITAMLKEDDSGVYFLGNEVSYADFVWGGFLLFMQRIGSDVWESCLKTIGEDADLHNKLLLGLSKWSLRDDK